MRHKILRTLSALLLFWALLPVLTGGCPCAQAALEPHQGLVLQKNPCHGCCPEITPGHKTQAFEQVEPAGFQLSARHARLDFSSSEFVPIEKSLFFFNRPEAPPGVPLYLSLEVFRI